MKRNSLLVTTVALLILLSAANTVQALAVVKSVPVIGSPIMAYDSYKGEIWSTTYYSTVNMLGMPIIEQSNIITAISDSNYSSIANVTVGGGLLIGIAYDSALHEIYVINENFCTVSIISDENNSVVATMNLNGPSYSGYNHFGLSSIVYDSGKGEMFVSNWLSGEVSVILDSTRQVVATISLGNNPYPTSLIYDSGKGEIFVCYQDSSQYLGATFMSVISDVTNSVVATVSFGNRYVYNGVYDSATGEIYTLCPLNSSILVISDQTNTVVDSIPLEHSPMGYPWVNIGFDPVKRILLVGTIDNLTCVISDRTRSVVETSPINSISMVYDSGRNLMVDLGNATIQFLSDELSPSPSPTSPSPSPSQTPSVSTSPIQTTSSSPSDSSSPANTPASSPTVPEVSWLVIVPLLLSVLLATLIMKHRRVSKQQTKAV